MSKIESAAVPPAIIWPNSSWILGSGVNI